MNILLTIHHNLDRNTGAPGVTIKLAEALRARGHAVRVFSHDDVKGVRGRFREILFPWFVLGHAIAHPEYDVLDMSEGDGWITNFVRRAFSWRRRSLSVTRSHGMEICAHRVFIEACRAGQLKKSWIYPFYRGSLRLWQCKKSSEWADAVIVLNDSEREFAVSTLGFDEDRIALIDNGIDDIFVSIAREALQCAPEKPEAGVVPVVSLAFIGQAIHRKGIDTLAAAATLLSERNRHVTLTVLGTGQSVEATLAFFPSHMHGRVKVIPTFDNAVLPDLLAPCQIFVFPSRFEGFGLAPLEAMACGLVPVVSDIAGPRNYIRNGDNGVRVPPGDAAALSAAVQSLIDQPARWTALQRRARETVLDYSWAAIAERVELLYGRHLSQCASRVLAG
ncbi:MAG: hypothetical protein QOH33_1743 [Paraburkholderia sp.]|nr:hypothetical protein [Paraburkholderia sp.]